MRHAALSRPGCGLRHLSCAKPITWIHIYVSILAGCPNPWCRVNPKTWVLWIQWLPIKMGTRLGALEPCVRHVHGLPGKTCLISCSWLHLLKGWSLHKSRADSRRSRPYAKTSRPGACARETPSQNGLDLQRPAMHRGMVDDHPAFGHHLLDIAKAQRVGSPPAHALQHDLERVVQSLDYLAQSRRCKLNLERNHSTHSRRTGL